MHNLLISLLQLSMIAVLIASSWVLHAIAVIIVESYGISGTAVALAIIYGAALMMENRSTTCAATRRAPQGMDIRVRGSAQSGNVALRSQSIGSNAICGSPNLPF
jgi:hypothetical protein